MSEKQLVDIKIRTVRFFIEEERQRLIAMIGNDWWIKSNRSDWARNRFGETLTEKTAEQIYEEANGDTSYIGGLDKGYCQICGDNFKLDEEFIKMSFSFCEEYSCGMNIHKKCKNLKKIILGGNPDELS